MKNLFISYKKTVVFILCFFVFAVNSYPQKFSISQVDPSGFPIVKASFIALNYNDSSFANLSPADFNVLDNNKPVSVNSMTVTCEKSEKYPEVSVVLVLDQSGSMDDTANDGRKRWEWVVEGAKSFISTLKFVDDTKVAIISFGSYAIMRCNFTNNKQDLYTALDTIIVGGKTLYNPPFLNKDIGCIALLNSRPPNIRRIAVFLTDGRPDDTPQMDTIINKCQKSNIQVYSITVSFRMEPNLERISEATGGRAKDVYTRQDLDDIYKFIALDIQSKLLCTLSWQADFSCKGNPLTRPADITFIPLNSVTIHTQYDAPPISLAEIELSDKILSFDDPDPNNSTTQLLTIKAINSPFIYKDIKFIPNSSGFSINWIDPFNAPYQPPDTIPKDSSITLKITFTQGSAKGFRQGAMVFTGEPCPPFVNLVGGLSKVTLLSPLKGDIYSICDTIDILWGGIDPSEIVQLSYRTEPSQPWITITPKATGLRYKWVPPVPSKNYQIKASVSQSSFYQWAKSAGGLGWDEGLSIRYDAPEIFYFYICGIYNDRAVFDDKSITSFKNVDMFIAKYDYSGNLIWVQSAGGLGNDSALGVCVDSKGDAYITGVCYQNCIFGNTHPSIPYNNPSFFIAKYPSSGSPPSVKVIAANVYWPMFKIRGTKIMYNKTDSLIYCQGEYSGSKYNNGAGFGLPAPLNKSAFTAIYDANLTLKSLTGTAQDDPDYSKNFDYYECNTYQTGGFEKTLAVDTLPVLKSAGSSDIYITRYGCIPGSFDTTQVFTVESPELVFEPKSVDAGLVTIGSISSVSCILKNTGSLPVKVLKSEFNGANPGDFNIHPPPEDQPQILPGDSLRLTVNFNPQDIDLRSAIAIITYSSCSLTVMLNVSGTGVCNTRAEQTVDCGAQYVGLTTVKTVPSIFTNRNNSSIDISPKISISSPDRNDFHIDTSLVTVAAGESVQFDVSFTPQGTGYREAYLDYNLPLSCSQPATTLTGTGILADLSAIGVDFKDRRMLTVNSDSVLISNNGSLDVLLTRIDFLTDGVFSIDNINLPVIIPKNKVLKLPVKFVPPDEGSYNNQSLLIYIDGLLTPLTAPLQGNGTLPKIKTEVFCGSPVKPGDSILSVLRVYNTSNSTTLSVTDIQFQPKNTGYSWVYGTAPSPTYVGTNDFLDFAFIFNPKKAGITSCLAVISNDAAPGPNPNPVITTIANLNCDAAGADFPPSLDMGAALLCDTLSKIIEISNLSGNSNMIIYKDSIQFSGNDANAFTAILDNNPKLTQLTINPGDKKSVKVIFKPIENRIYSAIIQIINSFGIDISVKISAEGKALELYTTKYTAKNYPGLPWTLPVLAKISELQNNIITDLDVRLTFNPTMIGMNLSTFKPSLPNWNWSTPVVKGGLLETKGSGTISTPFEGELFNIMYYIYLTDTKESDIHFQVAYSCDTTDLIAQVVDLSGVCYLDGRLIKLGAANYIFSGPNPNPASAYININYGIGIEAETKIDLINTLGKSVKILVDEVKKPGYYELNYLVDDIPSGVYQIRINSGPYFETKSIVISK